MFAKLLIANRGEIACRIIATARRLGLISVAVYSQADAGALHVELADEAWPIGPPPARDSYLDIARIIDAARCAGADALHPGYGFLSENAALAEACAAAGIVFVGPPAAAIRAMGSKVGAKALMSAAGVPVVPGYHGDDQTPRRLAEEAARIGFPLLVKASAGGGGKGMRVVGRADALAAAIEGARREAESAFGDDRLLLERYLTRPRHIEIQVFADRHGHAVHLFERDCSVQRRHQKVVEEAPALGMTEARRDMMGQAAIAAARAVNYVGAGTVEFIAEGEGYFFMEMNTRLQVEHAVTEFVTGTDLVEWQLRVAAGEPLPAGQNALRMAGHAIEARIYAEDPGRDFMPSIGTLVHLRQPAASACVRVDTGVRQGDRITPHYDPMIAKLIVHGADRAEALRRLRAALGRFEVVGVRTNLELLRAIAADPKFAAGPVDTSFIGPELVASSRGGIPDRPVWAAAALAAWAEARLEASTPEPRSPWAEADAWRLDATDRYQEFQFRDAREADDTGEERARTVRLWPLDGVTARLATPAGEVEEAALLPGPDGARLLMDGVSRRVAVVQDGAWFAVLIEGCDFLLERIDPGAPLDEDAASGDRVVAPIPARLTRVLVREGDAVAKGAPLVVLEAMKTELTVAAPVAGIVAALRHDLGDMVEEGTELVTLAPPPVPDP